MAGTSNEQIIEAISVATEQLAAQTEQIKSLSDQVKYQNGRVFALEQARINDDKARVTAAIETAAYQKEINDRLSVIEPITQEVSEIVGFTRTTGKIAKWISAICGALLGVAGVAAIAERFVT